MENLLKRSQSHICSALLKYGHSNFELTILEYCYQEKCLEREDYYIFSENHEYNICQKAGSSIGRKHSDETKTKISDALTGENHPMFGKTGENHPNYGKTHSNETKKKYHFGMLRKERIIPTLVKLLAMKLKQKYLMLLKEKNVPMILVKKCLMLHLLLKQ